MTQTLPPNIARRLTLARYQLVRARLQIARATEFDAWNAAVALHDGADLCLLALADFHGIPRRGKGGAKRYLHDYPALLEDVMTPPTVFFDRVLIEDDLSEVRNPAKHRGGFPGVADVTALVSRVEVCLDRNCDALIGRPLSAISLADMITDAPVRKWVKEAESHIAAGKFTDAIASLKAAWQILTEAVRNRFPEAVLPELDPWRKIRQKSAEFEVLERWWKDEVQPKLQMLMLGVDPIRFAAFEALGPSVHIRADDTLLYYRDVEDSVLHTAESADYCLMLVLDTVVRFQESGRIPHPHDYYRLEVIAPSPYYDVRQTDGQPFGELPAGQRIEGARLGGGPPGGEPTAWFWDDIPNKKTFMIPFSVARICDVLPRAEYEEVRRSQYEDLHRQRH